MPYEVLNARVKQKLNTEAQWIEEEDSFGVIFEGEQAFVYNEAGVAVNFKIGDGTKKFSELPYFIAYYSGVTNQKVLSWINTTTNITVPDVFKNNSLLTDLIFYNNSGFEIDLKVGTTDGGSELFEVTVPVGASSIECKFPFSADTTIYLTGITGKECSLFMLFFQLDETPAIPPTSTSGGVSFGYGTVYSFVPMYDGHLNYAWDFTTNRGKAGTVYENCIILTFPETYLIGAKVGDTIGNSAGANTITIAKANLPNFDLNTDPTTRFKHGTTQNGGNPTNGLSPNDDGRGTFELNLGGSSTPINIKPLSKIVLYFTGPATT